MANLFISMFFFNGDVLYRVMVLVADQMECKYSSNLQKHVTVSSTSNGSIIWPLVERSCRPIDEYRTLDNVFDAAPAVLRPTIVFNTFDVHITDDFSLVLPFRALFNCTHPISCWDYVLDFFFFVHFRPQFHTNNARSMNSIWSFFRFGLERCGSMCMCVYVWRVFHSSMSGHCYPICSVIAFYCCFFLFMKSTLSEEVQTFQPRHTRIYIIYINELFEFSRYVISIVVQSFEKNVVNISFHLCWIECVYVRNLFVFVYSNTPIPSEFWILELIVMIIIQHAGKIQICNFV